MIKKTKKIMSIVVRSLIKMLRYVFPRIYMSTYCIYLKAIGIHFVGGLPIYIDPSVYFDGIDYTFISIGKHTVISKDAVILTHDYSISRALNYIGREKDGIKILKPVSIGNNCFIGLRAVLLPGTVLSNNCIVGAGAVVKGFVPEGSIVVGNPATFLKKTDEYAYEWLRINGMK